MNQKLTMTRSLEQQVVTNFSGSNLAKSDLGGRNGPKGLFKGSTLSGSDFSGADLTGSTFKRSNVRETFAALEGMDANLSKVTAI